ncbi:MAG: hypothetical protein VXZ38_13655 [Planctomycetota bacterium]|nr:hypothetical protein [Planctomycetota bacterium]
MNDHACIVAKNLSGATPSTQERGAASGTWVNPIDSRLDQAIRLDPRQAKDQPNLD